MRIVIVGAGMVGFSLAEQLLLQNHDLTIIEKELLLCHEIEEKLDLQVINGSGSSPRDLELAGIDHADLLLAVTPFDEINILACAIAYQYGVPERLARIRSSEFRDSKVSFDLTKLGITKVIDPENSVVDAISEYILTPGVIEATSFENNRILVREYKVTRDLPVVNKSLAEIRKMNMHDHILVMTIVRDDQAIIPTGEEIVREGDEILVLFPATSLRAFQNFANLTKRKVRKVIISGTSLISLRLAQRLDKTIEQIIFLDPHYQDGQHAADLLDSVEVLHGDATEIDLLKEVHIENADFFIGSSKNTEHNVMSALLAKSLGAKEVIAISDLPARNNKLFKSIGIDHVINPRLSVAMKIMNLIQKDNIVSEIRIRELDLETIRVVTGNNSKVAGKPLFEAWKPLSRKAIVGAIIRSEELIVPEGNTVFLPGDQAVIITRTKSIGLIEKMFRARS